MQLLVYYRLSRSLRDEILPYFYADVPRTKRETKIEIVFRGKKAADRAGFVVQLKIPRTWKNFPCKNYAILRVVLDVWRRYWRVKWRMISGDPTGACARYFWAIDSHTKVATTYLVAFWIRLLQKLMRIKICAGKLLRRHWITRTLFKPTDFIDTNITKINQPTTSSPSETL